jgi:selenocysteine lyase/cysteine desulfurase
VIIIDATHAAGIMPLAVNKLDPDFLVFPTYKWVLGPYGRAFLYIAKRHQDGIPLEQTGYGRRGISSEATTYRATSRLSPARAASIWASVTISYLWKWPRSEWR